MIKPKDEDAAGDKTAVEDEGKGVPEPGRQRDIIARLDSEGTCTYAISKVWYRKWEEHVGQLKGFAAGASEAPGPLEMDTHNDGNNEYVSEEEWKRLLRWYGITPTHQLDRRHVYFKDEKAFDVCTLSPFSGIVEHAVKRFNRFEEIGYIECQMRRIFQVPARRKSRLWISEKAQVPRFRQLLLRARMLNDCIHRDKVYILALEEEISSNVWATGEPGESKGDLGKYNDLIQGSVTEVSWSDDVVSSLDVLTESVSEKVRSAVEVFLQDGREALHTRETALSQTLASYETKLDETSKRDAELKKLLQKLTIDSEQLARSTDDLRRKTEEFDADVQRFEEELQHMKALHKIQTTRIKLDIGGHVYTTSMQTLGRDPASMIAAMFSGKHELHSEADGSYFIDRDGTYFRYILNFLRDGYIDAGTLPNDAVALKELLREAKYYQLNELAEYLEELVAANITK